MYSGVNKFLVHTEGKHNLFFEKDSKEFNEKIDCHCNNKGCL
jgi:hypothetical protein